MNHPIDVSIIIPAYNAAATLGGLVTRLLAETRVSIELIVVDDGSTDGTAGVIRQIQDARLILIEQANQGVYAARNAALAVHRGEWVVFLDADDDIADEFIAKRWLAATTAQADVAIFNGWHSGPEKRRKAIHRRQPYGQTLPGQAWIKHCVTHREWPHYLWLQMVRSAYIRQHALRFQAGKSHKDILWTVHLAVGNGRFLVSGSKDYIYVSNTHSITHRPDYYDVRAGSYVEVIAELIRLAKLEQNKEIKVYLYRHALVEARHFLGLYRNRVEDKFGMKARFKENVSFGSLFRGISGFSDVFFFIKLVGKLL